MSAVVIREADADDAEFLTEMLVEAANWPSHPHRSREETLSVPAIAHYVDDWPRATDFGVVAVEGQQRAVGAAWLRFFPESDPGYGFVRADIPELAIGVVSDRRGRGAGRVILRALADMARRRSVEFISLSVERANAAARLYRSEGYQVVDSNDYADTMLLDLRDG